MVPARLSIVSVWLNDSRAHLVGLPCEGTPVAHPVLGFLDFMVCVSMFIAIGLVHRIASLALSIFLGL